jgi:hypothetical protein
MLKAVLINIKDKKHNFGLTLAERYVFIKIYTNPTKKHATIVCTLKMVYIIITNLQLINCLVTLKMFLIKYL